MDITIATNREDNPSMVNGAVTPHSWSLKLTHHADAGQHAGQPGAFFIMMQGEEIQNEWFSKLRAAPTAPGQVRKNGCCTFSKVISWHPN